MARTAPIVDAIIGIEYVPRDVTTYRHVFVKVGRERTLQFDSGDVIVDYADALNYAQEHPIVDEIILNSSCEEFVRDSNFEYAFDLNYALVKRIVY